MRLNLLAPATLGLAAGIGWAGYHVNIGLVQALGSANGLKTFIALLLESGAFLVLGAVLQFAVERVRDRWRFVGPFSLR